MSGVTDNLIKMARQVSHTPAEREMDVLLATGEQTDDCAHSHGHQRTGEKGGLADWRASGYRDRRLSYCKAKIANITPQQVRQYLKEDFIVIVAGFQGETTDGRITTLGRGGSDLTAIAIASAIGAKVCQIFTDVEGVYTCDPRIVRNARKIPEISYDEMLEMASSGSKVMQSRSVEFAKKFGVVFEVRSSFNQNPGTIVKEENAGMENVVIRGVSVERNQAKVTVAQVPDKPGVAARIFNAVAETNIIIDMIVQNVSVSGTTDISFTLSKDELPKVEDALGPVVKELGTASLIAQDGIAKLSVVGIGMRSHSGVAAKMFDCLSVGGINIQMISTSEIKIAVILDEKVVDKAANLAHEAFGLAKAPVA